MPPDLHAAAAALERAARALNMPPPPRPATKAEDEYREALAALVLAALLREITREEFVTRYTATVIAELEAVYAASTPNEVNRAEMAEALDGQVAYVPRLADDLYSAEPRYRPVEEPQGVRPTAALALLAFLFGGAAAARVNTWVNGRVRVANIARTHDATDPMLVWRLGATERHCRDCLDANGRVMRASEWRNLAAVGIHPQSPSLECGGWNCDCSLEQVANDDD